MTTTVGWQWVQDTENWCSLAGSLVERLRTINLQLFCGADRDAIMQQSAAASKEALRLRDLLAHEWERRVGEAHGKLS